MPKPGPARSEVRDMPRCPVCHWRHDHTCSEEDDAPVRYLGTTGNGHQLWEMKPSVPTTVGGRSIGHIRRASQS